MKRAKLRVDPYRTNGPAVLRTVPVGKGFGGPVVKGGKVYLLDRDDKVGQLEELINGGRRVEERPATPGQECRTTGGFPTNRGRSPALQ